MITKDTPVSELCDTNELMHYKYSRREKVNGEWRYWYNEDEAEERHARAVAKKFADEKRKQTKEKQDKLTKALTKVDRYVETAKVWVDARLNSTIADTISGKAKPMTWAQAKASVNKKYNKKR